MGGHSGVKKGLFENATTAQDLGQQYASNALGISSTLAPTLTAQMVNPQGYNPTTMGQMQTAAEQAAGGGNAAAVGTAGLRAARTRNIGSGQAAGSEGGRIASQELSQINAGIQTNNANLKAKQQAEAESGLGRLYGEDVSAGNNALGISNQALGTAGNLKNFWQDYLMAGMQNANKAATAGAGG